MDSKKLRRILEERLKQSHRSFTFDRERDELRIENEQSGKGITISLPGIVAKWHEKKEKAIDEVIYYAEEALSVMGADHSLSAQEKNIFPVIRSTSFPKEAAEEVPFFIDEHTAETNIYYALDLGKTYRLIDEQMMKKEGWTKEHIREIAQFNLRSLKTDVKTDEVAGNKFYFLNTNDGYDASRILNDKFLKDMFERAEGEMTVSVPHGDVLIVGDIRNETGYDVLAQMTMSFFTSGHVPITALSFLYEEGKLEPIFIMAKNRTVGREDE
ncbi:DUF1444 domain-containing protein [Pseudobacillus badius]|uniref:DUF1444 domain-containing protein n=1 Tax=Bacillus badius TaxID=1455 RepID=UPI0007B08B71|nr:DUF1444 domain-containing protein [Bacillus badius]KZO01408.1 hypothetical protein A4244_11655 [Bacillus badius]MED0665266.1 DUF1444 domain-containing protein [Bacillus badius]OCS89743.1 hypothetical protein A6M11_11670 [Bacillus badius]OVE51085.1 DUF1444 domain-containing protein [Bacillus badius]TDW01980.1 uncharacterized protein YtpQ (UPF0354 family) [Bacillus badius]